jgi:hypothetical protein
VDLNLGLSRKDFMSFWTYLYLVSVEAKSSQASCRKTYSPGQMSLASATQSYKDKWNLGDQVPPWVVPHPTGV